VWAFLLYVSVMQILINALRKAGLQEQPPLELPDMALFDTHTD
jgi:hypothetical protein